MMTVAISSEDVLQPASATEIHVGAPLPKLDQFFVAFDQAIASDAWKESGIFTATADDVLNHKFSFYGETHQLPQDIDWEYNPGTAHWVVDLNRFPFLDTLCCAYAQSNNRIYLRKAADLILSWIGQSDGMQEAVETVMCRSYLNVAIHLCYWVKTLVLIRQCAPELISDPEWTAIEQSIQQQVDWLDRKIPTHSSNWVFIGCRGIIVTAAHCPGLENRESLTQRAWSRISQALAEQVLPDGVHDEMTPHYHAVVIAQVLSCLDHCDVPPPGQEIPAIENTLAGMLQYLRHTMTPDGLHLAFNDADADFGPRVLELMDHPKSRALLGNESGRLESKSFPFAGTMFLRQGSSLGKSELYLAFDGGSFGMNHGHEDKLGFWLSAFGRSFIVDPGRHLYDVSEQSFRQFLNSTAAHSTITIDGYGQRSRELPDAPGAWRSDGPQPILWDKTQPDCELAGAFYDLGYGPEGIGVVHYRVIAFDRVHLCYVVTDLLEGRGSHLVESRLQFAPGELRNQAECLVTSYPDVNLAVHYQANQWDTVRIEQGATEPLGGWYSLGYNKLQPAPCVVFSRQVDSFPFTSRFILTPFAGEIASNGADLGALHKVEEFLVGALDQLKQIRALAQR